MVKNLQCPQLQRINYPENEKQTDESAIQALEEPAASSNVVSKTQGQTNPLQVEISISAQIADHLNQNTCEDEFLIIDGNTSNDSSNTVTSEQIPSDTSVESTIFNVCTTNKDLLEKIERLEEKQKAFFIQKCTSPRFLINKIIITFREFFKIQPFCFENLSTGEQKKYHIKEISDEENSLNEEVFETNCIKIYKKRLIQLKLDLKDCSKEYEKFKRDVKDVSAIKLDEEHYKLVFNISEYLRAKYKENLEKLYSNKKGLHDLCSYDTFKIKKIENDYILGKTEFDLAETKRKSLDSSKNTEKKHVFYILNDLTQYYACVQITFIGSFNNIKSVQSVYLTYGNIKTIQKAYMLAFFELISQHSDINQNLEFVKNNIFNKNDRNEEYVKLNEIIKEYFFTSGYKNSNELVKTNIEQSNTINTQVPLEVFIRSRFVYQVNDKFVQINIFFKNVGEKETKNSKQGDFEK
ncbi:hypothetical protein EDEG_00436 [Edhazardia aedis USNM 41457]|uniref:Uncharacterized protein n=1 Tax=Edhazardia aedis (strain USNM 41457) TaxID=1003232 RepID=J9D0U6_EDHAE|nr:hypothetical protein EDEG_00436 [Edhazardia aedis USNM 41457]|eukprot:EJW01491.1 hypothetical protein EDEG_00436 [Edhazardia aedis USNM 41457]